MTCGELDIVMCKTCGFVCNRAFDPHLAVYDEAYDNDQTNSPAFRAHVEALAAEVVASVPRFQPIDYLEIGCGQGGFIREVARLAPEAVLRSAQGFDPAWRGLDGTGPVGSHIYREYFLQGDQIRSPYPPNIVVSRHTIEHVPDPMSFLDGIRRALGTASRAKVFIETPCIDWILATGALQDLFYEHCSLFTASALRFALERSGFEDVRLRHVFGGQYLWATGIAGTRRGVVIEPRLPIMMSGIKQQFMGRWIERVKAAHRLGPVAIWGAGAKGATIASLTEDADLLDCAIDINPAKQSRYLPGSGLLILSPHAAAARNLATVMVMNSNYLDEIKHFAADAGLKATLTPIDQ